MRVALTAAIMDVFHDGHRNILNIMRDNADKVIVVLHDNLSCYRIKNKFPIQTVEHRKQNVLDTGLVDEVLITKDIDPSDCFRTVLDTYYDVIFVRGNDNFEFPGKHTILKYEIPILYVEYTKGISSSIIRLDLTK